METPEVTAIIPVYNDRESLRRALPVSVAILSHCSPSFEIIVAEDGSTDGSAGIVEAFGRADPRVRLLHSDARQGRGRALSRAIQEAHGSIVCYFDVDLATDMQHLPDLLGAIRDGYDMATGSRLLPASDIIRTGGREIASRSYNFLVRLLLSSTIFDHQCGFKAFNRARILTIIPEVRDTHWFWDTELLVRGQRKGFRVKEFAVRWRAGKGTTVKVKDIFTMGRAIFRLWWQIHVSKD